jgi:FK506-binding nuclear protein
MAAVDPTEEPEADDEGNMPAVARSTLRLVKRAFPGLEEDDEDDEIDEEYMKALLAGSDDEEDSDEEANGGPSDPAKAKKQRQAAAIKKLLESAAQEESDEEMEDAKPKSKAKGKAKATQEDDDDEDDDEEDSDDDSEEGADLENFVICTLDTEKVSYGAVCFQYSQLTLIQELPAASRHHCQPWREGLLRCHRYSHHLPHRKLHHGR